ncbi:glycoside hydrolase family 65 protein [Cesiribacter andamanensis]|uniref:Putative glycosyl hydrolase n=1 Tax=Cesiribacter andamanensis AMV16 TaxID=1279009 RepID=M7N4Q5_9BACT|nr:glycosyl hydrolase family 65 protein [Cesiribacter andamanensis]EMR02257.1 putative glycosyl hydrolase [Cesiribacter andamanensis AMV16]
MKIHYDGWKPESQKLREALCTLGNGYFASRGAAEEAGADATHYPGTYLAGGFNRAKTEVAGKELENEDFVNFPNWLPLSFKAEGGEWLDLQQQEVLSFAQTLHLDKGVLERDIRIKDQQGRITHLHSRRLVSMAHKHMAGLHWQLTPENWSGRLTIRTALDGRVENKGVDRYSELESRHLRPLLTQQPQADSLLLLVETRQSRIRMAQAARTRLYRGAEEITPLRQLQQQEGYIEQLLEVAVSEGQCLTVEKILALYTSRDQAISETTLEACKDIQRCGRFAQLLEFHLRAWERLWRRSSIRLQNGPDTERMLHLHIFHLLQTTSYHTIGLDVGVPSRGLHGEAYRGHIFWDELYIFPFLNYRFPEITRSLLLYRYRRLDEARYAARQEGQRGAMFPWQSGSNGREESQVMHLNPESGNWLPDTTHLQRHVNAAIAYNIWSYYCITADRQFLSQYGAELFLSIAQYWSSKASWNEQRQRFEICQVVGPDEYHTEYPEGHPLKTPGQQALSNNAYTNVMAAWVMQRATDVLQALEISRRQELMHELDITQKELERWQQIASRMYVPYLDPKAGILSQFEGYELLEEFPWEAYRQKYSNIARLDRILEKEGLSINRYKASKQADVLMLFYLFTEQQLREIFQQLGYGFSPDCIHNNIVYYTERTSHGSTLSRLVFSWVLARYDQQKSWKNFEQVLVSDFCDIQGGTTPEGIHLGAMAGSVDLVQRCYCGLEVENNLLHVTPSLPASMPEVQMRVQYRGHWLRLQINQQQLSICLEEGHTTELEVVVMGTKQLLRQGQACVVMTSSKGTDEEKELE